MLTKSDIGKRVLVLNTSGTRYIHPKSEWKLRAVYRDTNGFLVGRLEELRGAEAIISANAIKLIDDEEHCFYYPDVNSLIYSTIIDKG